MRARRIVAGTALFAAAAFLATVSLASPRASAAPPAKETPAEWVAKVVEALARGPMQDLADLAEEKQHPIDVNALAAERDLALTFAKAVHDDGPRRSAESRQTVRVLILLANAVGRSMTAQWPADWRTKRTTAYALASRGKLFAILGTPTEFPDWLHAGELAAQSYDAADGQKDGGECAARGLEWMRGAAAIPGADAAAFAQRVEALSAVVGKLPESPFTVAGKATAKLAAIDAMLEAAPAVPPPALRPALDEVLALVAPQASPAGDLAACTIFEECVTIARSRRLPMKLDYLWNAPAAQLNVTWQLPLSSQWKEVPVEKDAIQVAAFQQRALDGHALHTVVLRMYRWEKTYGVGESKPFKGDSTRELALAWFALHKKGFASLATTKDVVKGTISDGMGPAQTYELVGTSAVDGRPLAARGFVVRGRDTKATFLVEATTLGKAPPGDPELDAVLKTFREVKAGK